MSDQHSDKIWGAYFYHTLNLWPHHTDERDCLETLYYDEEMWDFTVESCAKYGFNTIFFTACDGVQYDSHPEISLPDAWSKERVHKEIARCRELGITIIPEINFSSRHSWWMKDFRRMTSSKFYYPFCVDIINEIYEMFEHPKYIMITMDEEVYQKLNHDILIVRCPELFYHDAKFLVDEVNKTGATPIVAGDPLCLNPDMFTKYIKPDEVLIGAWYYWAYKEEDFETDPMNPEATYNTGWIKHYREAPYNLKDLGYKYLIMSSCCCGCSNNELENVRHFHDNFPDEQIVGHQTTPWVSPLLKNKELYEQSFQRLYDARKEIYGIE